jgi:hypothetical protein
VKRSYIELDKWMLLKYFKTIDVLKFSTIWLINSSCKLNGIYVLKTLLRVERVAATAMSETRRSVWVMLMVTACLLAVVKMTNASHHLESSKWQNWPQSWPAAAAT